jgi:hypothetical protein
MQFNPNWKEGAIWPYNNVIHRTDFCHFINSIYSVLDKMCEVYVLTNYTVESEKVNKINWLNENLKCKHIAILNKEGITKSLYVNNENDILVDDTFRNLAEWSSAGGTFFAAQYVCCEKGRRELLEIIVGK